MTTLGRTVEAGYYFNLGNNYQIVSKFTTGSNDLTVTHGFIFSKNTYNSEAKSKFLIYSDNGGNPDTLIASSAELVGFYFNWNVYIFETPPTLTANTAYWLGLITDTGFLGSYAYSVGNSKQVARTYTSGPLSPWSGGSSSSPDGERIFYVSDQSFIASHVITQEVIETISNVNVNLNLTQFALETILDADPNIDLTQLTIETLTTNALNIMTNQFVVEMISTNVPKDGNRVQTFIIT